MSKQHTLERAATVTGIGLHTGKTVTMTFQPAAAQHGVKFQRIDLDGEHIITADVSKVVSTNRGTTLRSGEADRKSVV